VLTIYTVMSGEVGGILTQAFQGFIMVVAGLIMTVAFFVMAGGFGPVLEAVSTAGTITSDGGSRTFTPDLLNAWGTLPGSVALAWVVIPVLGVICQPQVITRMYALKNPRDLPKMGLYVTIAHMIVAFMVVAVGYAALYMVARGVIPPLAQPDQAIFVFADHLGLYAQLFVYTAVLAAAMSTSSLFLSLSGGIISRDLPSALRLVITPERQVTVSRVTVFALGIGAIIFALTSGDMVAILGTFGFGALMSATLPVFVIGLLWKGASSQGVFAGLLASLLCNVFALGVKVAEAAASPWRFPWPGGLPWYVHAVAITAVVAIAVSLFTRGATGATLDRRVEAVIDL
jgi:Na+/proline symporter